VHKRSALVTAGLTAALALAPLTSASAGQKPKIDFSGSGAYGVTAGDVAVARGTVTGTPFTGTFRATLQPVDGSLPEPGVCEPGRAAIRIDGAGGRYAVLVGAADICGQHPDATYVVTQVFSSDYDVAATSVRKLRGGDGWMEIRLTTDGRAVVTAFDS
jgi:hypothetical protein